MMSKFFCALLIVGFSVICLSEKQDDPGYTCGSSIGGKPPTTVIIQGMQLECGGNQVCNEFQVVDDTDAKDVKDDNAVIKPCIDAGNVCGNKYKCEGENVVVGDFTLTCGAGFECNAERKYPCNPCIEKACPEATYSCPGPTDRDVSIQGLMLRCNTKSKCNKGNVKPCTACIDRASGKASYLTSVFF